MNIFKSPFWHLVLLLIGALVLRFVFDGLLDEKYPLYLRAISIVFILIFGTFFVLMGTAEIIEETTGILSNRTKIAGGVLQSLGTAFPDMVLGIAAALISLRLAKSDYSSAVNYAIIAASTTFGSNIYNIGHATWCIFRQNLANKKLKSVLMFPYLRFSGTVKPMSEHQTKTNIREFDTAIDVLNVLTLLTATVAISMVLFGRVANPPPGLKGDLYQMVRPVGLVILLLGVASMYFFRKSRKEEHRLSTEEEENYYQNKSNIVIFLYLLFSGIAIWLAAETMINAVKVFSDITSLPFVVTGVLAGVIGCMGEIIVIHNFTVHPKGRLGDAVVGVAMDNIVTTIGASIVAVMGGIFLGGNALILIFIVILAVNTVLIWQISRLKNYFLTKKT